MVLVQWSPEASTVARESIRALARSLESKIPGISRLAEGPSTSPEGLEQGFDYALVIDFTDALARDHYLSHPAHLPLAQQLQSHSTSILVFDLPR